ncbi:DJ-1/PfpI family protein [Gordonia sp. CPCC 206044]|uniref:GlxA family transcriptional regulator n=1 Tax=Gordonia sp. CPCC 206044 TaxID=3140793 RepID=UPI003AF3D6A9
MRISGPAVGPGHRRIGIVVFDDVKMLDFSGPAEVFVEANQYASGYSVSVLSPAGGEVRTSVGVRVSTEPIAGSGTFDTVLIAGSELPPPLFITDDLVDSVRDLARRTRRLASVCTGSFVLAAAGLLDGRVATTHWKFTADLARHHPSVRVDADAIFVRDDFVYSSAGVVAGIDLSLALVEEDHGAAVARRTAQGLLVYMQRGGGQSQFSSSLRGPAPRTSPVRRATDHVRGNPHLRHTVDSLSSHVNVSARQLTRLFRDELDTTPAEYVATARFELACDGLHAGYTVSAAAHAAGYSSAEVMRRAFIARIGISPRRYQQRFTSTRTSTPEPVASVAQM